MLIALYENRTPFEFRCISPDHPQHVADWLGRWPLRKFPVLVDGDQQRAETSVIIEHLQFTHPGPTRLIPHDPVAALDVRFFDRFFDLHVMDAAQHAVDGALTGDAVKRRDGLARSIEMLERAYAWADGQLAGKTWATGDNFTLADCAAGPSLFYADWVQPSLRRRGAPRGISPDGAGDADQAPSVGAAHPGAPGRPHIHLNKHRFMALDEARRPRQLVFAVDVISAPRAELG